MTDDQIKYMVERFLGWRLPENFNPDAGISFKPMFNEHTAYPMKHEPTGTNLFDYAQTEAMIRYLVDGISESASEAREKMAREVDDRLTPEQAAHVIACSYNLTESNILSLIRRTQPQWIGVEKELPAPKQVVFVWTKFDKEARIWAWNGDVDVTRYGATHWMPLPAPPEGA